MTNQLGRTHYARHGISADSALRLEQEELRKLEEQFENESEEAKEEARVRRNSRRPTAAKVAAEEKQKEENGFDDKKALDEALAQVFAMTGINDVDVLIERLTQTEEIHFGLFKTINELEAEASKNERILEDAEQELKRVQRCGINNNFKRQKEMEELSLEQKSLLEKIRDVENQCREKEKTWNSIRSRIMTVHDELGLSV